jgi:hypothetical protein
MASPERVGISGGSCDVVGGGALSCCLHGPGATPTGSSPASPPPKGTEKRISLISQKTGLPGGC